MREKERNIGENTEESQLIDITWLGNEALALELGRSLKLLASESFVSYIAGRCETDSELIRELVELFIKDNSQDQQLSKVIVSIISQIESPAVILQIEAMLKTLFERENQGIKGYGSMRLDLYAALGKFPDFWQFTSPSLLNALIKEGSVSNVYEGLKEAILSIGKPAVDGVTSMLTWSTRDSDPEKKLVQARCEEILLGLGLKPYQIQDIVLRRKKKKGWF